MYYAKYREDYVEEINCELLGLLDKTNIAIWGLSEYAEKLFIYSDLIKYDVKYYVDSNRIGLFLENPICTPQDVDWDDVGAVIITSVFRHEEIERLLREEYDYKGLILKPGNPSDSKEFYRFDSRAILKINENYKQELDKNQEFYNIHKGKKCYILGNGPSINQDDLSKIDENSIVFAVNDFYRQNKNIKVDYYVAADPFYFDPHVYLSFGEGFFRGVKGLESNNKDLVYFFPIEFRDSIKRLGVNWANTHYFYANRYWDARVDNTIDLTKRIFARWAVTQYCIQIAVYMGVRSIYLLGCEETGILGIINNYLDDDYPEYAEYAYKLPDKDLTTIKDYFKKLKLSAHLSGFVNIINGYEEMNELCKSNGIKLFTCAQRTIIKSLDYCCFDDSIE